MDDLWKKRRSKTERYRSERAELQKISSGESAGFEDLRE
jgi:hypothetical protein